MDRTQAAEKGASLPDMLPGSPIETEWNVYRRELPRLLAEGQEGRWVLIKGEQIVGLFASRDEAVQAGYRCFGVVHLLAQQIVRQVQPIRAGDWWRCQP